MPRRLMVLLCGLFNTGCDWLADRAATGTARETVALGDYCRSLQVGDPWSAEHAQKAGFIVTADAPHQYRIRSRRGVSLCLIDLQEDRIARVVYRPD